MFKKFNVALKRTGLVLKRTGLVLKRTGIMERRDTQEKSRLYRVTLSYMFHYAEEGTGTGLYMALPPHELI